MIGRFITAPWPACAVAIGAGLGLLVEALWSWISRGEGDDR